MYQVRRWVTRHPRTFEKLYNVFESILIMLAPIFRWIGFERLEMPMITFEKVIKGFLFDSQMCGMCTLSKTGMACPMNCPKTLRNGPCGGVRSNGTCEVKPEMACVWVDAFEGSRLMKYPQTIEQLQPAVDHRLQGRSSWLREVRIKTEEINKSVKSSH
ncbi:MAG: methylenetetrahydrofolate reductase C-terminal domain-containing protein [Gammaproteobacteria bacterium]|nr:methylenetetrahydrofolate reductase C-terminal domain-containing protein [Gammaproteobacteria bacterium]